MNVLQNKEAAIMLTSRQNVSHSPPAVENISILVVSSHPDDVTCLRVMLHHSDWRIAVATCAAEAAKQLQAQPISVIICERDLPDGSWKEVLQQTQQLAQPPLLLVVSKHADENLWAEVLNLGGYDVLLKPLDRAEVLRVVGMAWRWWSGGARYVRTPALTPQFA
jgi:two-component system, sensor histidine kinase and response regulator